MQGHCIVDNEQSKITKYGRKVKTYHIARFQRGTDAPPVI